MILADAIPTSTVGACASLGQNLNFSVRYTLPAETVHCCVLSMFTSYLHAATTKSQLSAHKFRVQKCSNMAATGPPSSTYPRTPSCVGTDDLFVHAEYPDDLGCTEIEPPCVGVILDFQTPHQPSCIATETSTLKARGHQSTHSAGGGRGKQQGRSDLVQGELHDGEYSIAFDGKHKIALSPVELREMLWFFTACDAETEP